MQPNGNRNLLLLLLLFIFLTFILTALQFFGLSKGATARKVDDSFFDSQNAMLASGTVTAVNDRTITVQNKKGMKQDFGASKSLMIMSANPNPANPGNNDLKNIELGKEYNINFSAMESGVLEISSLFPVTAPGAGAPPPVAPVASGRPNTATNSAVQNTQNNNAPVAPAPAVTAPPAPAKP